MILVKSGRPGARAASLALAAVTAAAVTAVPAPVQAAATPATHAAATSATHAAAAGTSAGARAGASAGSASAGWTGRWVAATEPVTDVRGATWAPDAAVAQGGTLRTVATPIASTASPALYQHNRLGVARYAVPVPAAGTYAVVLHLADTDGRTPGQRVFDVSAAGAVTRRVDTAKAVGLSAAQQVFLLARATGTTLTVQLRPIAGQTSVSAIAVSLARTGTTGLTTAFAAEFAGPAGTAAGAAWTAETGAGGWGNHELQTYTARTANASLDGRGALAITARREDTGYTSARLDSVYRGTYGHVEARIKVPAGAGLLPAFWMLGDDIGAVGWPACGEIDVLESLGAAQPNTAYGTLHGPDGSARGWQSGRWLALGAPLAASFHVFSVDWWPNVVQLSVDGVPYATFTPADLPASSAWAFDKPYYLLLNVAVGGDWPGTPPAATSFPQTMLVDYVRWTR